MILLVGMLQVPGFTQTRHSSKKPVKSTHLIKKKRSAKKPVMRPSPRKTAKVEYGTASFYSNRFVGKKTANGDVFSQKKLTAAHNRVPLGTYIRITSMKNKKSVIVKVTDRMHARNRRIVDLTRAGAQRLGNSGKGLLKVKVEILGKKIR